MELIKLIMICILIMISIKINKCIIYTGLSKHNLYNIYCKLTGFIGIPIHELSHMIMCGLTGTKINKFQLYDINNNRGFVKFINRGPKVIRHLQCTLSGMAPIIGGMFLCIILQKLLIPNYSLNLLEQYVKTKEFWIYTFLTSSIIFNMDLSMSDLKNVLKGIYIPLIILVVLYIFDFNIINIINQNLIIMIKSLLASFIVPCALMLLFIII